LLQSSISSSITNKRTNLLNQIEKEKEHYQELLKYHKNEYQKELHQYNKYNEEKYKLRSGISEYQYPRYLSYNINNGLVYIKQQ
jgi:protein subunit release factor B